jgi:ribosomal protein S2
LFWGGNIKSSFPINYALLTTVYTTKCFTHINLLILTIKRLIPTVASTVKTKNDILFIGTRFLYSKTVSNVNFLTHQLITRNPGIFSNFSITSFYTMNGVAIKRLPTMLFFFYVKKTDYLLKEAKLKNIPVLALIDSKLNSTLVDYPIAVDSSYFHTLYFFSLFFFRLLRLN